jgi:FkbM family methyltransferase
MLISVFDITICDNNLGNQIIMESVYNDFLKETFPFSFFIKLPYLDNIGHEAIKYLSQSDFIFFPGGNSLSSEMEVYKQWGIDENNYQLIKNVILIGVGWWQYQGDISTYTQNLLKSCLHPSICHSVRDSYTKNKLSSININNVIVTGCPSLWGLTKELCKQIKQNKSENVLLTFTNYSQHISDLELLRILRKNYKNIFVWIQGPEDFKYAKNLGVDLKILPPSLESLDELLSSEIELDYVGTRLHAGIRAMQFKRRAIIIGIDNRALEMKTDFNLNVIPRNDLSSLHDKINSNFETSVNIPFDKIKQWKEQFNIDRNSKNNFFHVHDKDNSSAQSARKMFDSITIELNESPKFRSPDNFSKDYQIIAATNNLSNIKLTAQQNRLGNWQIELFDLTVFCHDLAAFYIAAKDIFLHRIYDFYTTNPTPNIIDGGGHIGLFTLYIKKKYPKAKITVFEPDTESVELLTKNIDVNNIHDVELVEAGLYKYDGEIDFGSDHSDGSSIFAKDKSTKVKVVRLSQYINSEIDFLKLNIEGAELDVLTEIEDKLSFVKEMVIEYHGFPTVGQNLHKILAILDRAGFRYMIHDFDAETNPAAKPPFQLDKEKQFFLLIYAKKLFPPVIRQQPDLDLLREIDRVEPISRSFGFDRGTPIDRYYIEQFLEQNSSRIRGRVLEIGDNTYTQKYGTGVTKSEILNAVPSPQATIAGDLATGKNVPEDAFDCIILTQTLLCIYDVKSALTHAIKALKLGGTLLITVPGISQISRYDMDRWGDYWRFTDKSLKMLIEEAAPDSEIEVQTFGNVAVAKAYLDGLALEELPKEILDIHDNDYQLVLTAIVKIPTVHTPSFSADKKTVMSFATPLILLYHRVADDPLDSQLLAVSPYNFEAHLKELSENYRVISLYDLIQEITQYQLNPDTIALTFDDGYLDNLINAVPLLEKYKLHASIFVTSGMVGSEHEFWWDALERVFLTGRALPVSLEIIHQNGAKVWDLKTAQGRLKAYDELCAILRSDSFQDIQQSIRDLFEWAGVESAGRISHRVVNQEQLKKLAESPFIEIGSHTVTHARLSILPPEKQRWEIQESKIQLEAIIHKPVRLFSYPYGTQADFTQETVRLVMEASYVAGIANIQGNIIPPVNLNAIPRRLVRNWAGDAFAQWLTEKDKDRLETETLSSRAQKLINYQILVAKQ